MNKNQRVVISFLLIFIIVNYSLIAQEDEQHYVPVSDTLVIRKLEKWQAAKFGLLMHWGTYSQWGIVESWSLCGEDEDWCQRTGPYADNYEKYKQAYSDLKKTFNPVKFDPSKWAEAAQDAGMKYVIFTTKHHDGFCMFDTKTTDYKITSQDCPFSKNSKANATKEIFDAFRKNGMMVGTYFSKPDWSSEYYWWQYFPTPDRHVNYNPAKYPERWNKFQDFTYNQIEELMTDYGPIDILWLDGAWVRPSKDTPKEFESWAKKNDYDQSVNMPRIAAMARQHQPGLIVVDRWVNGMYENYLTPENKVPEKPLLVPWESCIPMATSWSYVPNDKYKSTRELIHLLIDVVAKGGNLLLNIGPSSEGEWDEGAYDRLKEIGKWMDVNKNAIYNIRPVAPYKEKNICFTKTRDGIINAIYLADEKEQCPAATVSISSFAHIAGCKITMLGVNESLQWKQTDKGCTISIPKSIRNNPPCRYAWVFKISKEK